MIQILSLGFPPWFFSMDWFKGFCLSGNPYISWDLFPVFRFSQQNQSMGFHGKNPIQMDAGKSRKHTKKMTGKSDEADTSIASHRDFSQGAPGHLGPAPRAHSLAAAAPAPHRLAQRLAQQELPQRPRGAVFVRAPGVQGRNHGKNVEKS